MYAENSLKIRGSRAAPAKSLIGRRDWTRTNDPHHVKVVL